MKSTCDSSCSSVSLTARNAVFVAEKWVYLAEKAHLDPAAWVLPGKINAIENALTITGDLSHCRVKSTCDSLCFSVSLTARRAGFGVEKGVDLAEKAHIDPAAWVLPGKINAMGNCAHCNRGLTTLLE